MVSPAPIQVGPESDDGRTGLDWEWVQRYYMRMGTYEDLMTPAIVLCPDAFMIRDLRTSAGEQTAIVYQPSPPHLLSVLAEMECWRW